jgi:hypothetical protein
VKLPLSPKAKIVLVAALLCLGSLPRRSYGNQTRVPAQNTEPKAARTIPTALPEPGEDQRAPSYLQPDQHALHKPTPFRNQCCIIASAASQRRTPSANASSAVVSESQPRRDTSRRALPPAQEMRSPKRNQRRPLPADEIPLSFQGARSTWSCSGWRKRRAKCC